MKRHLLAMAAFALALTACENNENENITTPGEKLENPVAVNFAAGIMTRVSGNQWDGGEEIGISAESAAGGTAEYTNVQYVADVTVPSTSTIFKVAADADPICFLAEESMDFTAYYPYTSTLNADGKIDVNTLTDQANCDFLYAKAVAAYDGTTVPNVNFTFAHKMAQIKVTVTPETNANITGKDIVLGGLKHQGSFDPATGIAVANTDAATEAWTIGTATDNNPYEFTGIILPQNASSISMTIDGLTSTLDLGTNAGFQAGYTYHVTATVKENQKIEMAITINGSTIDDWKDGSKAKVAFIGDISSDDDGESTAAYNWLKSKNKYEVTYYNISIENENSDLSQYQMVWVHLNILNDNINESLSNAIKSYYVAGGSVLASREAMPHLTKWDVVPGDQGINEWLRDNVTESLGYAPGIEIVATSHALFSGFNDTHVNLRPSNYYSEKKMLIWKFDDQNAQDTWKNATNATILARDGSYNVTMAEFQNQNNGHVIAIGDPAFEWYKAAEATENVANLYQLTTNAIDYLISQSAE